MRRIHMASVASVAMAASLALAACAGGSGAGGSVAPSTGSEPAPAGGDAPICAVVTTAGDVQGSIQDNTFDPNAVALTAGQSVTFTNQDGVAHTVTLDDGKCDTGNIAGGSSATLQFSQAGSYPFHCNIHPAMKGTFEVT